MQREFEPFPERVYGLVIPSGRWQRVVGVLLYLFGLVAAIAATPFNGAGAVASLCFAAGSGFLFWGVMMRYLSALEEKIGLLLVGLDVVSDTEDDDQSSAAA